MRWVLQNKTPIAIILGIVVLIVAGIWFWGVLVGYVKPTDAGERKDVIQTFALILAGVVGAIGAIVGIANFQTSRRNLQQQCDLEEQRAHEDVLRAYFEQMGDLLTDHDLINTDREDIRQLAQAQTHTVVARLDGKRKGAVVRFLHGAGLINAGEPIVQLIDAQLREASLTGAGLHGANFHGANLFGADLAVAHLISADLGRAYLENAQLFYTNLDNASLADADLTSAYLRGADVSGADLSNANLSEATGWTAAQLEQAASLEGATMPNGQKYEDWLKSQGREENE